MSNILKCPYCNKPLHCGAILKSDEYLIELYQCANPECESTEFLVGCKGFWDILGQHKRTRKELKIAVDALKEINDRYESEEQRGREEDDSPDWWDFSMDTGEILTKVLEQITALEQKEAK